jgi:hypothetical protein
MDLYDLKVHLKIIKVKETASRGNSKKITDCSARKWSFIGVVSE